MEVGAVEAGAAAVGAGVVEAGAAEAGAGVGVARGKGEARIWTGRGGVGAGRWGLRHVAGGDTEARQGGGAPRWSPLTTCDCADLLSWGDETFHLRPVPVCASVVVPRVRANYDRETLHMSRSSVVVAVMVVNAAGERDGGGCGGGGGGGDGGCGDGGCGGGHTAFGASL